jgi:hypothetical protein
MNKKIIIYAGIGLFIVAGIAATPFPQEKPDWKNLKVMPKNTTEEQMERIMYQYTRQLSVTCLHCHPYTKPDIFPKRVDFVTDELPEKVIARNMMRMTNKINQKYFNYKIDYRLEYMVKHPGITCFTCHRGLPKPII